MPTDHSRADAIEDLSHYNRLRAAEVEEYEHMQKLECENAELRGRIKELRAQIEALRLDKRLTHDAAVRNTREAINADAREYYLDEEARMQDTQRDLDGEK